MPDVCDEMLISHEEKTESIDKFWFCFTRERKLSLNF